MSDYHDAESIAITLYALQTCSHCKAVKNLLQEHQTQFETVYVDMLVGDERNDTMRRIKRINPSISFPTLLVGEKAIVGFKEKEIIAALDVLPEQ